MAGGQERVLRRRIKSVQSTRKITKAMELIAASQIARAQARIAANRPYRAGMARIILETAKGDSTAAGQDARDARERPQRRPPGDRRRPRPVAAPTTRPCCAPPSGSSTSCRPRAWASGSIAVGKKASGYFRFHGSRCPQLPGDVRKPTTRTPGRSRPRPPRRSSRARPTTSCSSPCGSVRRQPGGRDAPAPAVPCPREPRRRSREAEETAARRKGYKDFEPRPRSCSRSSRPGPSRPWSSTRCSRRRPRSHTGRQRAMAAATDNADELVAALAG